MTSYDSIIFDLDGTLWNASEASASGWNAGLVSYGLGHVAITARDIRMVSGRPFQECVRMLLPDVSMEEEPRLLALIDCNERSFVESRGGTAYEGVVDGVRALAERYPLFLVSNCQEWYLEAFWKHIPIEAHFRASDCFGRSHVPKAEMIRTTAERHGLLHPIYIGDTDGDERASKTAEVDFGHVGYGFGRARHPAMEFRSFGEIVDLLVGECPD